MTAYLPGGTAYYFAHGAACLNHPEHFSLVTSLGESEYSSVEEIRRKGIDVQVIPSHATVYFENKYGENLNDRTQRVLAKADPFRAEALKEVEAEIFHLGTLLADDFSLDVLKELSARGTLAVDAQGYLREVREQAVFPVDWKEKKEAMQYIDVLKVNEHEMEVLTGLKDLRAAAAVLAEWGVKEVLLTLGSLGSVIYAEGQYHEIPAYEPKEVVDATGCGDTYMTGYLYRRALGDSYDEAGRFAAAMSTLKLEHAGPFASTEQEVYAVIEQGKVVKN
jgi:sugar/nucleoside kinase (ribokinase family)